MTEATIQINYLDQAIKTSANKPAAISWLADLKSAGQASAQAHSWPTRKTEHWKYTNLSALNKQIFVQAAPCSNALDATALADLYDIADLDTHKLVFLNGQFIESLSTAGQPENVEIVRFSEANAEQQNLITQRLGKITVNEQHLFSALNDSLLEEGVFVRFLPRLHPFLGRAALVRDGGQECAFLLFAHSL